MKYYVPANAKTFGYAQVPRQQVMPYQNEVQYQKLLKRHQDKGHDIENFEFPYNQGKVYKKKTEDTIDTLAKHAKSKYNIEYIEKVKTDGRRRPDTTSGFRKGQTYLQGRRNVMINTFTKSINHTLDSCRG